LWIFDDNYGVLNAALVAVGLPRIPWLSSPHFAMATVILTTLWLRIGLCMVIFLAALQDVPREQLEAATLDGAKGWQQFRFIIWPVLRPSSVFLLLTNLIYSIHVFDVVYVMTGGGPAFSTTVLVQYLYEAAFEDQRQGYASAIGVIIFLILALLSFPLLSRQFRQKAVSA
jgi:ABC-type sugar transport system permease subunit